MRREATIIIKNSLLAAIIFSLSSLNTNAETYTVINTNDNGPGSLRAAIATANSTPTDDLIVFDIQGCPEGVCTIGLSSARFSELTINASNSAGSLTISNPSGPTNLIVRANFLIGQGQVCWNRIFYTEVGSNLRIEGLTMERGCGEGGGAIANGGDLTISKSIIRGNTGIFCGGGILNGGNLVITGSEIRDNFASEGLPQSEAAGGGICSIDGSVLIRDSTIASNSASGFGFGGGIALFSQNTESLAVIANSTISGNNAFWSGGGVYLSSGTVVRITNSTTTMNSAGVSGGAVFGGGSMFARNSIFAGNTAANFPDIDDRFLVFNNLGNNLIGGSPLLAPLANNGGPTRTHALLAGSPAIDAGNNCVLTANGCGDNNPALSRDQRGFDRLGAVDIGAFEFSSLSTHQLSGRVTTSAQRGIPRAYVTLDDGSGNLRSSMTNPFGYFRFANVPTGNYTVSVRSKSYGFTPRTISASSSVTDLDFVALGE